MFCLAEQIDGCLKFTVRDPLPEPGQPTLFLEEQLKAKFPSADITMHYTGDQRDGHSCGQWATYWLVVAHTISGSDIFEDCHQLPAGWE